jgi:hypothetical protein
MIPCPCPFRQLKDGCPAYTMSLYRPSTSSNASLLTVIFPTSYWYFRILLAMCLPLSCHPLIACASCSGRSEFQCWSRDRMFSSVTPGNVEIKPRLFRPASFPVHLPLILLLICWWFFIAALGLNCWMLELLVNNCVETRSEETVITSFVWRKLGKRQKP